MLDESTTTDDQSVDTTSTSSSDSPPPRRRRRAASRPAGPPEPAATSVDSTPSEAPAAGESAEPDAEPPPAAKRTARKSGAKKAAAKRSAAKSAAAAEPEVAPAADQSATPVAEPPARPPEPEQPKAPAEAAAAEIFRPPGAPDVTQPQTAATSAGSASGDAARPAATLFSPIFRAPDPIEPPADDELEPLDDQADDEGEAEDDESGEPSDSGSGGSQRRRRRRGGRRRRRSSDGTEAGGADAESGDEPAESPAAAAPKPAADTGAEATESETPTTGTRRRRRRRRRGEEVEPSPDDPANTVVRVREPRGAEDEITALEGSTRMEAKKQRRREGRAAGRRRAPIVSEAEFLARRESVKREMVIRQRDDVTQIAVMEDGVLVEHYVARDSQTSLIGNVYLGRVQNVLPSMEAAFIDIGKGRNAVLYAGEVDWAALGMDGKPQRIEDALKSGQTVLVQVTKDPVGHKGARLTGQISLPGRFLVYVPNGHTSGISRKLPDTERNRLKDLLKQVLPEDAGVIVRTAAEGATEEQLNRDVAALTARWEDITKKSDEGQAPRLLYAEPDLMLKVVRDLFNEDFSALIVDGDDAWDAAEAYVKHVAPDLAERLVRWDGGDGDEPRDVFAEYRIDEQIQKALDRKVWLPSGGSLVIDRTEAMTVIDVNTGKFTGSGGNLEETVTKNNLEAAEEVVRQLRLRDIGGIIVIDFIDMVLESNRDLVLRRLVECLGRDRTRHQVAEVTSLGLVQMTRKRIGTGLLEAFSEQCQHCKGRGVVIHSEPIEPKPAADNGSSRRRGKRGSGGDTKPAKKSSARRKSAKGDDKPNNGDPGKPDEAVEAAAKPVEQSKPEAGQPAEPASDASEPVGAASQQ